MQIESAEVVLWLQDQAVAAELANQPEGNVAPMSEHRAELVQEQTRRLRLQNEQAERELVPANEVQHVFSEVATIFSTQLDALAGRLAGGDAVERDRIFNECRRIRLETADALEAFANDCDRGVVDTSATEADAMGVGGKQAQTAERGGRAGPVPQ